MNDQRYIKIQPGMIYGMLAGSSLFVIIFSLPDEIPWILAIGVGMALGLGIGSSMDQSEG